MLDEDGVPLRRIYVCPEHEKPLDSEEIIRGYELEKGQIVPISDDELEALEPRKTRDIEIRRFVDRSAVPATYFDRSYLLAPGGTSSKAYHLLAEVMDKTDQVAIASFVMREKEYLVAIFSDRGVLRAETMRFSDELRSADDVGLPEPAKVSKARVKEMAKAIAALAEDELDRDELRDEYAAALSGLAERKHEAGQDVVTAPAGGGEGDEEPQATLVDLMAVLKRRLGERAGTRSTKRAARRHAAVHTDLDAQSRGELYERAKALDIPGRSQMTKDELLAAIRKAS